MKSLFLDIKQINKGLTALEDTTSAVIGSFAQMRNVQVTDRGGVSPRPGTKLFGTANTSPAKADGFYNFIRSFAKNEILMRAYSGKIEIYSLRNPEAGWFTLKSGFTAGKDFGFIYSLVNDNNQDYVAFCNRYEPYQVWDGAVSTLSANVTSGATSVPITTILTDEVLYTTTPTANTATTVTVSTPIATDQWKNLVIYFPSTGKVRKVSSNTSTVITFATLGGAPGNIPFEIRKELFALSGSVIYNNTVVAYTTVDVYNALPVTSAPAGTANMGIASIPVEYPENPRGNRLTTYLTRIFVGNVRSAVARDNGGVLQGFSSAGSTFVSKIKKPTDFTYSASRIAGEGDIIQSVYGAGDITDVQAQEDAVYIFKNNYIEQVKYSQDVNDLAVRVPLKPGAGSVGKTIRTTDDIYFFTQDKKFTSIGRTKLKDILPQTENVGFQIKRLLDTYEFDAVCGAEYKDKIYVSAKSSSTYNNIIVIYSKRTKTFEGIWDIGASDFMLFNSKPMLIDPQSSDVYEILGETSDVIGTDRLPINAICKSNFMNLTPSKNYVQALCSVYFEGYITANTEINFKVFKSFEKNPFLSFIFKGSESKYLQGAISSSFLGNSPIGLNPIGAISDPDQNGRRHFQFTVYFPFQYSNYFAVGWESSGVDFDYEIIRYGLSLKEDVSIDTRQIR